MKKHHLTLFTALLAAAALTLSACTSSTPTDQASASAPSTSMAENASTAASDPAAGENTLSGTGQVTVYSAYDESYCDLIFGEFTKDTGIQVKYVRLSGGEIYARIQTEAGNPQASCWFGSTAETMQVAGEEGLLESYVSPNLGNLITDAWVDSNHYWTPHCLGVIGILSNNPWLEQHQMEAPSTWEELLDPVYKDEIIVSHPATSGLAYTWLNTIVNTYGEEKGFQYLTEFNSQVLQYSKSGTAPSRMITLGEAAAGVVHSHEALQAMQNGYDVSFRYTPQAGAEIVGMAVIKGAPEQETENAKKLIDWALTTTAQEFWSKNCYRLPAVNGVELADEWNELGYNSDNLLLMDISWNAENRERLINRFETEIRGQENLA